LTEATVGHVEGVTPGTGGHGGSVQQESGGSGMSSAGDPKPSPPSGTQLERNGIGIDLSPMSDGGETPDGDQTDAGSHLPGSPFCINNPDFEGPPPALVDAGATCAMSAPSGWGSCGCSDVVGSDGPAPLAPFSGAAYFVTNQAKNSGIGGLGAPLCAPFEPGRRYAFSIQLAKVQSPGSTADADASVEIWGTHQYFCGPGVPLWSSPRIHNVNTWQKFCGTFVADTNIQSLSIVAEVAGGSGDDAHIAIDDFRPGDQDCP
jgi:hypothetical protein